jgi:hypothetical protein
MRDETPAPPPKAYVDRIIFVVMGTFFILLIIGFVFNWTPVWVVGVIGSFWSLAIYFFCPPKVYGD